MIVASQLAWLENRVLIILINIFWKFIRKLLLIKLYLDKSIIMNNIPDKFVLIIILITILFIFALIFSVKSPERKLIDSPIIWKDDFSNIIFWDNDISKIEESLLI